MFLTVVRFEIAYWLKRPLTLLFFALFFLFAFFSSASDAFLDVGGTGLIHRNAPFAWATAIGILTAIGQVITTAIAGTAVVRDAQVGMQELLFTTRLSRVEYLVGRFVGSFVVMLFIYSALPVGLLVGIVMPWVPQEAIGPVSLAAAFQPFLVIAVPNLLFVSALFFAVGALTRKLFAVYITGILLLVTWQITQQITSNLDRLQLAALVDPFGLTTIEVVTRYWSVTEKNTQLVAASGVMLQNRLLWCAAALALFAAVVVVFRLRLAGGEGRKRRPAESSTPAAAVAMPAVSLRYDAGTWLGLLFAQARFHFRSIIREAPFLAISAIAVINLAVNSWYTAHPSDSARWPVTSSMAPGVGQSVGLFIIILATLYGGELIWRERQLRADQIHDALPAPAWVGYGGKLIAVFLAILVLPVIGTLTSMVMQLAFGYTRLQPGLYAQIVATDTVPLTLAMVALAIGVHALVNQKFVGHLIIIAYWVLVQVFSAIGFDHRLYQIGRPPAYTYSDMNGWGPYVPQLGTLLAYTAAFCATVAAVGYLLLSRGTESRVAERTREAGRRARRGGAATVALLGAVTAAIGAFFYYNANVVNDYTEVRAAERMLKAWELQYKPLESLPSPRVVAVTLRHDFYPERRAAAWQGTMVAVNKEARAIDTLFVALPASVPRPAGRFTAISNTGLAVDSLVFDRTAELIHDDAPNGVRLYRFTPPLATGDTMTMRFAGRFEPQGFPNDAFNHDVARNGSFMNSSYLPSFGYPEGAELAADDIRRRNGLEPKPRMMSLDDPAMREKNYLGGSADWITYEETACTSEDQIAIAPGYLQREWTEGDRRCFRYVMDRPILAFFATLSARYTVTREEHNGVALEIYHLAEHDFALPSMLQASRDGLDYFAENFSPYLYRQFRILEFPQYQSFAQAFPNTIPYSEGIGFLYRTEEGDDKVDLAYFVTAHELAHQWWAHQVIGGDGQGSTMFSEGLAEYSALTVMEKRYGREAAQKFLRRELDGYLQGRGQETKREVPLMYVENQPYIHYRKGSLAFYALRDYIGEEAMNTALRAFLAKWALQGPPYPNSRDLMAELDAVTPDSLKYVLTDLFEEMTFFENKADSATATQRSDGRWDVRLVLSADKLKGDSLGVLTSVPIADYIDIGVFGERVAGQKLGEPLLVQKVQITGKTIVLDLVVDKEPQRAGIDPYNKLIDRTPEDNVTDVRRQ